MDKVDCVGDQMNDKSRETGSLIKQRRNAEIKCIATGRVYFRARLDVPEERIAVLMDVSIESTKLKRRRISTDRNPWQTIQGLWNKTEI